ncbi:MAG TPA: hypothetical protein DCX32_00845 [Candidatus Moranbacteria bacterium]|nr:MAG: hypothetical protein UW87_C0010G0007 [Candidatus Moranbacteria bacterium GW2011_GWC2_45_10]KKT94704.1 MAG: hypothetical protein UW95_C0010G0011 [Parcubacteria group bacterium GW2011_GWC1_45_14]HAV11085.1 hypothetical protein [Candidatus Moranbacteria bacterium]
MTNINLKIKHQNKKIQLRKIFNFKLSFLFLIFAFSIFRIAEAGVISDAPRFTDVLVKVLQFLLSAVSILAIMMLVVSGAIYFFAAGDRRAMNLAKKSTTYAIVGIIVSLSAMVITRLITSFF